jgi:hypothetical protein
MLTEAEWQAR